VPSGARPIVEGLCAGRNAQSRATKFILYFQYLDLYPLLRFCNGWPKKQRRTENPLASSGSSGKISPL
jgi:hypothetical protein